MQVKEGTWYKTKSNEQAYVVGYDKVNRFWTGSVAQSYNKRGIQSLWDDKGHAQVPDYQLVEEWHEPTSFVGWVRLTEEQNALGRHILFPTKEEAAKDVEGRKYRIVKVTGTEGVE